MTNEMIERVAAALALGVCKSCARPCVGHGGGVTPPCERSDCKWREASHEEQACAAIKALTTDDLLKELDRRLGSREVEEK